MKMMLIITHPHVYANPWHLHLSLEYKLWCFRGNLSAPSSSLNSKVLESFKNIKKVLKTDHMPSVVLLKYYQATRILLYAHKNGFIQQFLLLDVSILCMLISTVQWRISPWMSTQLFCLKQSRGTSEVISQRHDQHMIAHLILTMCKKKQLLN